MTQKRAPLKFAMAIAGSLGAMDSAKAESLDAKAAQTSPENLTFLLYDEQGETFGTGVVVSAHGAVTNTHVVEESVDQQSGASRPLKVINPDGEEVGEARVVYYNRDVEADVERERLEGLSPDEASLKNRAPHDIATLCIAWGNAAFAPLDDEEKARLASGLSDENVQVHGFPQGFQQTVEANYLLEQGGTRFRATSEGLYDAGGSGGGVWNSRGELVGLVSAVMLPQPVKGELNQVAESYGFSSWGQAAADLPGYHPIVQQEVLGRAMQVHMKYMEPLDLRDSTIGAYRQKAVAEDVAFVRRDHDITGPSVDAPGFRDQVEGLEEECREFEFDDDMDMDR